LRVCFVGAMHIIKCMFSCILLMLQSISQLGLQSWLGNTHISCGLCQRCWKCTEQEKFRKTSCRTRLINRHDVNAT